MHVFPVPHTERLVTVDLKQFYIYSQFLGTCMYVCTYVFICVCVCVCVCVYGGSDGKASVYDAGDWV